MGTPFLLLLLLLIGSELTHSCDMDQTKEGCRIVKRSCSCGFGCKSEYRYESIQECQNALRGRRSDICTLNPCMHGGHCMQISQHPGYRCRCEGTQYYGVRCNRPCPVPGAASPSTASFPYECVVI